MIEPGELHRYFIVREIATGAEVWILGGDTRYTVTDGLFGYRTAADGDYFLARPCNPPVAGGRAMRLEEVEPLPDGRGLWGDAAYAARMLGPYEGSFRQMADDETVDQAAERHDDEMFGPQDAEPQWATEPV